jgi:hypothetical protein
MTTADLGRGLSFLFSKLEQYQERFELFDAAWLATRKSLFALVDTASLLLHRGNDHRAPITRAEARTAFWTPVVVSLESAGTNPGALSLLLNSLRSKRHLLPPQTKSALDKHRESFEHLRRTKLPWATDPLVKRRPDMMDSLSGAFWREILRKDPEVCLVNPSLAVEATTLGMPFAQLASVVNDSHPPPRIPAATEIASLGFFPCIPDDLLEQEEVAEWFSLWQQECHDKRDRLQSLFEDLPDKSQPRYAKTFEQIERLIDGQWFGLAAATLNNEISSVASEVTESTALETVGAHHDSSKEQGQLTSEELAPLKRSFIGEVPPEPRDQPRTVQFEVTPGRASPYVVGEPIKGRASNVFVGRDDVFDFLHENLSERPQANVIVLFGLRRMGKTSIFQQVINNRNEILGGRLPLLIDLASLGATPSQASFFLKFANSLYRFIPQKQRLIDPPDPIAFDRDAVDGFWEFIDSLESAYGDRGILMMWDEFQSLDQRINDGLIDRDAYMVLRDILQGHDEIDVLIAGTMRLANLVYGSALSFYGSAKIKKISFLDQPSARTLVVKPVEDWLRYHPDAVDALLSSTSCHPLLTQHFCDYICESVRHTSNRSISVDFVRAQEHHVLEASGTLFHQIWEELSRDQRRAIRRLSEFEEPMPSRRWEAALLGDGLTSERFVDARRGLLEIEIAASDGEKDSVRIPMLRRWVLESRPRE